MVWVDGCSDVSAHELQLRELAIYQSIKIPIYERTGAVATSDRVSDVVQGRTAAFRVFFDVTDAFKARDLGVRLTITNPRTVDRFSIKQRITKTSSDDDAQSTFMLAVPGDLLGADTQYSVEIVECVTTNGDTYGTRFPDSGAAQLSARKAGVLKVTVIPVLANKIVPDTSTAALAKYRQYLEAMYPIEHAEVTVGKQISTTYPLDWNTLLEQIRTQRASDSPAADVYYYGMVQPTATLKDYCSKGCTAGVGYVTPFEASDARAAVGLAYGGDDISASTMAHEIGHNHGRKHAPCPAGITGADENTTDATVGNWGYDLRTGKFFEPSKTLDIMGYCEPKWVSGYSYRALLDRVAAINDPGGITVAGTTEIKAFRVLIVDEGGPRWSQPFKQPVAAYGEPELADVLDIDEQVVAQVTVYRSQLPETAASTVLVPEPETGWNAIRVAGAPALAFSAPVTVPDAM
jgi:hypothetical protein